MKKTLQFTKTTTFILLSLCLGINGVSFAQTTVFGEGRTLMGAGDALAVRNAAKQDALRDAVVKAIKDATALDASDAKYAPLVSEISKQLRDVQVREERREGANFVTRIEAMVDRRQIKNAIRGTELDKLNDRSFSILMLVDEFVTSSRDLNLPLKEMVEFSYDTGASYKDKSSTASANSASNSSAVGRTSAVQANSANATKTNVTTNASYAAQGSDATGSLALAATQRGSYNNQSANAASYQSKETYGAAASNKSSNSYVNKNDIDIREHESLTYRKLIEYQDTSKPNSKSIFLSAFGGNLRDYDLRLIDASNTRSKFFGDKAITLASLTNSAEMSKFSEFARTKANADFLMVGSSTVVGGDKNPATGEMACVVNAEVKVFATASNEMIASTAESTQASGMNIEACAALASKKIADLLAPVFANRTLGYWADRSARGRQFTVELKGSGLSLPSRLAFTRALREIQGVADVEKKEDSDSGVKVTLTLKGKADAMELVYTAVSNQPAFSSKALDGKADGEQITLCIDKCLSETPTKQVVSMPELTKEPLNKSKKK